MTSETLQISLPPLIKKRQRRLRKLLNKTSGLTTVGMKATEKVEKAKKTAVEPMEVGMLEEAPAVMTVETEVAGMIGIWEGARKKG